ncbi:MAG TPA: beta-ketoacyl-[acyl-carrier-protein] synthase family protein [Candidatus Tectomicrobia bacterium]|nr:beta-ketoacyl-[acyl-carrier-protein] synthase family protein [Candidatus Tectomicrobia bacterium]
MRRVVVTGMGILSSIGIHCREVLESLQQGRSGIELIPERRTLGFRGVLGGRVKGLGPPNVPKRNLRQMGPGSYLAVHAAQQALADAGLAMPQIQNERTGIIIGNIGNMQDIYRQCRMFHDRTQKLGGTAYQRAMGDSVSANLAVLLGIKGYSLTVSAACATGAAAIGHGAQLIAGGLQDVCICGGVQEDSWEYFCQFDALQVYSTREDEPTKASRPFDKYRDGLVPSAGCSIVILEEVDAARRRAAKIYAELVGYAFTCDGYDMTVPSGEGSARCMEQALRQAGLTPDQVDYVNAHATSTPLGDAVEAQAIAKVFGYRPYVSSTKSMTGHEQGASGSNEIIYTLLMMEHGFVAPNINLEELDAQCRGINLVANHAIPAKIGIAASNAFGFGGVNTCIILKKFSEN